MLCLELLVQLASQVGQDLTVRNLYSDVLDKLSNSPSSARFAAGSSGRDDVIKAFVFKQIMAVTEKIVDESSYLLLYCYHLRLYYFIIVIFLRIKLLMYQIKCALHSYCYNITNYFSVFKDHDNNCWLDTDGSVPFPENSVVHCSRTN